MLHASENYENVIRDFCHAAGLADWQELARTGHIAIGDRLVGLIPHMDGETPRLSVCIELGQTYPERDSALLERLLVANMDAGIRTRGHYALHAESRQAVYCMCFDLGMVNGAELAVIVDEEVRERGQSADATGRAG